MPSHDGLLLLGYLTAAASLARAAAVSGSGARLGRRWPGRERRGADRHREDRRRTLAWRALAGLVALAGVLRVTGGIDVASAVARDTVKSLGWYVGRGPWQLAATAAAGAACLTMIIGVARSRRAHRRQRIAVAAAATLTALLAIRAVSWHDAGEVMVIPLAGVRLATWLEGSMLLALTMAGVVAARPHRTIRRHEKPPGWMPLPAQSPETAPSASSASSAAPASPAGSGATV